MSSDFTSKEAKRFRFVMGTSIASALSGFIAGVFAASVVWVIAFQMFRELFQR